MLNETYKIYPAWKDVMVYDEGPEHALRLDCDGIREPYCVTVPAVDRWAGQVPPWAHERRSIILDRLRAAGCIICESGNWVRTFHSPDGTFRVEVDWEPDERGAAPRRSIRIVLQPGDVVLAHLGDAGQAGPIEFPSQGLLTLPFEVGGVRHRVQVNVHDRTFWNDPGDAPRPLDALPRSFAVILPPRAPSPLIRPSARARLAQVGSLVACSLFVSIGLWQALAGRSLKDQIIGGCCAAFFGACALVPINALRKWARPQCRTREPGDRH